MERNLQGTAFKKINAKMREPAIFRALFLYEKGRISHVFAKKTEGIDGLYPYKNTVYIMFVFRLTKYF